MCGISGVYANHITEKERGIVSDITHSQSARGPDHTGLLLIQGKCSEVVFGHNRLSIVDLSTNANQPFIEPTNRYSIVYNGEIYNFIELRKELENAGIHFRSHSDTEVVLNAFAHFGVDALCQFRGPFSFAIYDNIKDALWLCRDRFGIRPLYYIIINNTLYFASTTNVLAKRFNLKPNPNYLAKGLKYLIYEDNTDETPYVGLYSLSASHVLRASFDSNKKLTCHLSAYYNLQEKIQTLTESLAHKSERSLLDETERLLEEAVRIRLRTDVPFAISLSSGLDSSSIAYLVSKQQTNLTGFSFSEPSVKKSEGLLVEECAKLLNIDINYVWPSSQELMHDFYRTLEVQDAPFPTFSIVAQYTLYKKVREHGIKVLLGGQGGDEVFMGYKKFLLFWIKQLVSQKRYVSAVKKTFGLIPNVLSEVHALPSYWQHRHRYFKRNNEPKNFLFQNVPSLDLIQTNQPLWQRQIQDVVQTSLPTLLRYEDRNAMGNSVESRLPYMDHHLVEFGIALPHAMKLRHGYGKWIIRDLMKNNIPDTIRLARFKRGFDIPISSLIQNGLGKSFRDKLVPKQSIITDFLNKSIDINTDFGDKRFLNRHETMREAITLLWIAKVLT